MSGGLAQAAAAAVQATEASVKDPKQLSRHVNDLQTQSSAMLARTKAFPILFGRLLKNTALSSVTVNYIAHGLGRPYVGYLVTQYHTLGSSPLVVVSLPSGKTPDKYIALTSAVNGTFDLYVF